MVFGEESYPGKGFIAANNPNKVMPTSKIFYPAKRLRSFELAMR